MKWSVVALLLIASLIASRSVFAVIGDPEGPNLLVVGALAVLLFAASTLVYWLIARRARGRGGVTSSPPRR